MSCVLTYLLLSTTFSTLAILSGLVGNFIIRFSKKFKTILTIEAGFYRFSLGCFLVSVLFIFLTVFNLALKCDNFTGKLIECECFRYYNSLIIFISSIIFIVIIYTLLIRKIEDKKYESMNALT